MAETTPVRVPRDNVNDDSVKLTAWLVPDGQTVVRGQAIAEIETSKAAADIEAPAAGVLKQSCRAGDEVEVGGVLGYIGVDAAAASAAGKADVPPSANAPAAPESTSGAPTVPVPMDNGSPVNAPAPTTTRLSAKAAALLHQRGIDPASLDRRGLLRERDVLELLGEAQPASAGVAPARVLSSPRSPVGAAGVPVQSEPLPRSKLVEGKYLSAGLHGTLPSVVTVACPTRGIKAAAQADANLRGDTSAVVVYEAARLLRKYPAFNAYYSDGQINKYEQVNVGFAMDAGRGLKVPVIRNADAKSISQISLELQDLLVQYLDDKLPIETLAGGTFTVTDLSGEGVFAFHPLLNQGQSAILGIGGEFLPPGGGAGMFNLILGFDHQLSEGRQAARFLNDLKYRIAGYEQVLNRGAAPVASEEPSCSECLTPISEIERDEYHMLQMVGRDGTVKLICSRCVLGKW